MFILLPQEWYLDPLPQQKSMSIVTCPFLKLWIQMHEHRIACHAQITCDGWTTIITSETHQQDGWQCSKHWNKAWPHAQRSQDNMSLTHHSTTRKWLFYQCVTLPRGSPHLCTNLKSATIPPYMRFRPSTSGYTDIPIDQTTKCSWRKLMRCPCDG